MTRKTAYVEDCPDEDDVDTYSAIPLPTKKVNFADKLPRNRENDSAIDSGYQSWTGKKDKSQTNTLEKERNASRRVEIKIENNGKNLGRERSLRENQSNKKRTKGKSRVHSVQDISRGAVSGIEMPEFTVKDTRFRRENENIRGFHSPCDCQACQKVLFSKATAAQQPFYNPSPQSQSTFPLPSMIRETLPNTAFIHVNRSNRPRTTEKIDGVQKTEPEPRVRSTAYETASPSNLDTHEHENPSYASSSFSNLKYHSKGNFYSHSPMYFNVSQPIDRLGIPSYQLPSYPGPQNDAPPLSPTVAEEQYDYNPHNMSTWWLPDWSLRENNHTTPHGFYSPEWDMRYGPKQQTWSYLPSQYSTTNIHPTWRVAAPNPSLDASAFMRNEYKASQTMDNTNANHSQLPLHPPIRPRTVASFISAKDPTRRDLLSREMKNKIPVSTKKEKSRQFKDPSGHPLREATIVNQRKWMDTTTPLQNVTENNDNTRQCQSVKVKGYTGHKAGTYKLRENKPDGHAFERRQSATADDERYNSRPHPLTKGALAKLNNENGDDIDIKVRGICRANSSRSTIFDVSGSITGNKGKRGKH